MRKIFVSMIITVTVMTSSCSSSRMLENNEASIKRTVSDYEITMKRDILCLMMAYPEYVTGVERSGENIYILMKSGNKIIYDDKKIKTFDQKVQNPDIQDMFEQVYPIADIKSLPETSFDPGRVRLYPLLKEVYGGTREGIQKNLTNVSTPFRRIQFNKNNKASESLGNAMNSLYPVAQKSGRVAGAISPISGTFNYRVISGTNLLSAHSFGIAIDLASDKRDYWKWATRQQGQQRLDSYPREIVTAFEGSGFIWGGKWGHFDILHFEYRPEIVYKGRYFTENRGEGADWYEGVPLSDETRGYIQRIDGALQ
jgi:hypothetical protein